jgi:hypothetical protein
MEYNFTANNSRLFLNIRGAQIKFEIELMDGSGELYATDTFHKMARQRI